jgi:hypothetical protein
MMGLFKKEAAFLVIWGAVIFLFGLITAIILKYLKSSP